MDAASIASGLSFSGYDKDKNPEFYTVKNVSVRGNVFSYDIKYLFTKWNMMIQHWLKNYVYLRVIRSQYGGKSAYGILPSLVTFITAAIWHGFYYGYFMFFILGSIVDFMYKQGRRLYVLFLWMPYPVRWIVFYILTWINIMFWGVQFVLLDFARVNAYCKNMYYSMHWVVLFTLLLFNCTGFLGYLKKREQKLFPELYQKQEESKKQR
mmetsp:Transcript_35870/g.26649  ORF Transcript_35870/g.26649 Transcript_35870/m.26649 type:complete len:209 (-) Transcript_35870:6-632(-)